MEKLNLDWFFWMEKGYKIVFSEKEKNGYIKSQLGNYKGRSEIKVFVLPWLIGNCYAVKVA